MAACAKYQTQALLGATRLDSTASALTSRSALKNYDQAQIRVVAIRVKSQAAGTPPDSCGSGAVELTVEIAMANGQRFSFSGHGDSPCSAEPPGDAIGIRLLELPMGAIAGIQMRSSKPIIVQSIEWESWQQGI